MLQLNYSQSINTNAVYPDTQAAVGTTSVLLDFSQVYDRSEWNNIIASLANVTSLANPWLVTQLTGSLVPTASGQYDVYIYQYTTVTGSLSTWILQNTEWASTNQLWDGSSVITKGALLSTDRAYIIGNNEVPITVYTGSNQDGAYTTYQGY
jgi:hypothetical protein